MLKITPVNSAVTFKSNPNKKDEKYSDPLMNWPARGLAYTNEFGAAISEVAPKLGLMMWVPALLYFGADIYDKYKNEKTSYAPNAQRGTEQAIFQALASVALPTGAVIAGQKAASAFGVMDKTGLSLQSREEIINFLQDFTSRRNTANFINNIEEFKTHFEESLSKNREKLIKESKIKNPLKIIGDSIFSRRHPEAIAMSQKDRIMDYANKHIDEMFEIYSELTQDKKPKQFSDKLWKKFGKLKDKFAKDPDYKTTYVHEAAESVIKKYQKSQIMKNKMIKTVGGFVALGLAIKPIDKFVENVVIKKFVQPQLTNVFAEKDVKKYKEKTLG